MTTQWKLAEIPPSDGREVLVLYSNTENDDLEYGIGSCNGSWSVDADVFEKVTHWMELPSKPNPLEQMESSVDETFYDVWVIQVHPFPSHCYLEVPKQEAMHRYHNQYKVSLQEIEEVIELHSMTDEY
ncbi:MAG TPA: DUF551 domain-containing protein [Dyadobacter sp.]|jgi:hypothetical protein|nr:DUF551 domain-containing protein [Dyadobacter sp.]